MTKALDRVKAAEAKYTGMVEVVEKLEATLKELKSTARSCSANIRELHRDVDRHRKNEKETFWMFVLFAGVVGVVGGLLGNVMQEIAEQIIGAFRTWWWS